MSKIYLKLVMVLVLLFVIIVFIALFSFHTLKEDKRFELFYWGLSALLVLFVTFRPSSLLDYGEYLKIYHYHYEKKLQPSIYFIREISHFIYESPYIFFFLFAIIGVGVKLFAIKKLSKYALLSLITYLSGYFVYHELIQIRAGVAAGFLLLSIKYIYERKHLYFILFASLGSLFHLTGLIIFPLYFLNAKSLNKWVYLATIFFAYLLALNGFYFTRLVELIPINQVQVLYESYSNKTDGYTVNLFSFLQLLRVLILVILILKIDLIRIRNKYAPLLVKVYTISILIFVLFSDYPVLSFRLSQMFGIVEIISIPLLIHISAKESLVLSKSIVLTINMMIFYLIAIYSGLLL